MTCIGGLLDKMTGSVLLTAKEVKEVEDHIDQLEAENAKLRELCVKALEWLRWAGGITCPPEVPDEFADELRKLGLVGE